MGFLQAHREEDYNRILMFSSYANTVKWEDWFSFFSLFFFFISNLFCRRQGIWYHNFVWFRAVTHLELSSLKSFLLIRLLLFTPREISRFDIHVRKKSFRADPRDFLNFTYIFIFVSELKKLVLILVLMLPFSITAIAVARC